MWAVAVASVALGYLILRGAITGADTRRMIALRRELELGYARRGALRSPLLFRRGDGFVIQLEVARRGLRRWRGRLCVSLDLEGRFPAAFRLVATGRGWSLDNIGLVPDFETGDRRFDARFFVMPAPGWAMAALTGRARRALLGLHEFGVRLEAGRVQLHLPLAERVPTVERALRLLAVLGAELGLVKEEIPERLVRNVLADAVPGVRLACFEALTGRVTDERLEEVSRVILEHKGEQLSNDGPLRLAAARRLGREGRPALRDLALQFRFGPQSRCAALKLLCAHGPPPGDSIDALLQAALRDPVAEVSRTAGALRAELGYAGAAPVGRVSLVDPTVEAGELSLASDPRGQVTILGE